MLPTAYCGMECSQCPTYQATQSDDLQARETAAGQWSKIFRMRLSAEEINCDGCKSDGGRLFGHCRTCRIKQCCTRRGLDSCAGCEEYACEELSAFFALVPQSRIALEAMRKKLS
jgi:hypothetical protein